MNNTYFKLAPNAYVAKSLDFLSNGDSIIVTTKRGKENDCIVHKRVGKKDEFYLYSVIRADGFNSQTRAENRAKKYQDWADSANKESEVRYNAATKIASYMPMGQPILVGHHSEKRHRRDIGKIDSNMSKSVELSAKAESHASKAEYWESLTNTIDLSMPESIEYFQHKLDEAKKRHEGLKSGAIKREHSFSLTYAKKEVNELAKKVFWAEILWKL